MKHVLTLFTLTILCLVAGSAMAQFTGVVSVDSVEVAPGEVFEVAVRLSGNNAELTTMDIPLRYDTDAVLLDSVSFDGTLETDVLNAIWAHDNDLEGVIIRYLPPIPTAVPIPGITASDGVLARLFFTAKDIAASGMYPIDSANVDSVFTFGGIEMHLVVRVEFTDNLGQTLMPEFEPGGVHLRVPTGVEDDDLGLALPTTVALSQNYPNPFNPTTTIEFALPVAGNVHLEVFNVLGQKVVTLVNGSMSAGNHQISFDASGYTSGIYFYRLTHPEGSVTKKMTLVK